MAPKNVKTIRDLIRVLTQFEKYFERVPKETTEEAVDVIDILTETDLYSYDFERLHSFFDKADLVKKLNGFMQQNANKSDQNPPFSRSILYQIREFIRILSLNPADGKLVVKQDQGLSLQYLCLNPAIHLKRLIDQADKVILASGTLEPTEEYDVLSKYMSDLDFMYKFSCDHVISQENY